ncbi:hypothetical protein EVAR_81970_1 [Eumeta japonica]|uniref:Uncharacterized protein n=1 Tax=Eumeta variegata TaxID=151549 RepID=A0A4C1VVD8_EUMVA|nr:hypothetical protein EVAR_81970_1 [Eumeta japonica]
MHIKAFQTFELKSTWNSKTVQKYLQRKNPYSRPNNKKQATRSRKAARSRASGRACADARANAYSSPRLRLRAATFSLKTRAPRKLNGYLRIGHISRAIFSCLIRLHSKGFPINETTTDLFFVCNEEQVAGQLDYFKDVSYKNSTLDKLYTNQRIIIVPSSIIIPDLIYVLARTVNTSRATHDANFNATIACAIETSKKYCARAHCNGSPVYGWRGKNEQTECSVSDTAGVERRERDAPVRPFSELMKGTQIGESDDERAGDRRTRR